MSRIYFHSPDGDAEVSGRERAYAAWLSFDYLFAALDLYNEHPSQDRPHPVVSLLPFETRSWIGSGKEQLANMRLWFRAASTRDSYRLRIPRDKYEEPWIVALNTAWAMGSDPVRFLMRIHGQCEIHGYVEGSNRRWLSSIIEDGLRSGLYREKEQWASAIALLDKRADQPVVMSYSVTDQFPNRHVANYQSPTEDDGDSWYELPADTRWSLAMQGLRARGKSLEMTPDHWQQFYFGSGMNGFELLALANELSAPAEPSLGRSQ